MDLFDHYTLIKNENETYALVFLKPCLLEICDKNLLKDLVIKHIKEKAANIHRIEVILKPLHILSIKF